MIRGKPIGVHTFVVPHKDSLKGFIGARKIYDENLMYDIDQADSAIIFTASTLVLIKNGELKPYNVGEISNKDIDTKFS